VTKKLDKFFSLLYWKIKFGQNLLVHEKGGSRETEQHRTSMAANAPSIFLPNGSF
jgi:hypothetical protein